MPVSRSLAVFCLTVIAGTGLHPAASQAQWWSSGPVDFEHCVEHANAAARESRGSRLAECEAKFAGRRKPGGGYTYYDFMQNRHFDIAGPNPTDAELKQIDQHYTAFLEQHRRGLILAAFTARQQQQAQDQLQQQSQDQLQQQQQQQQKQQRPKPATSGKQRTAMLAPRPAPPLPRPKPTQCRNDALSCGWMQLSAGLDNFKKTLLGQPKKPARSRS